MWIPCARALLALVLVSMPFSTFAAAGRTATAFDVSQTGEANYSIPIFTPPGTHGMTPQLAFAYGHRSDNTLLGVGWGIAGLSAITRCPRTWAQDGEARDVRNDYSDKFCLNGNRLRWVAGASYGANGAEYRTEIETFARIISYSAAGNGPEHFIVEQKDGLIYEYGKSEDSRIQSVGQSTIRAWAVNKIRDREQNEILFTYAEDTTNGGFRIYRIDYTQNTPQSLSAQYRVEFTYETKPSNEIDSGYLAGSLIKEITRLTKVEVTHLGTIVRRYNLAYEGSLSSTSRSRLASVTECGVGGTDCLPATTFAYQNGTPGIAAQTSTGVSTSSAPLMMDVNGDGRDDLVYSSHAVSGSGHWMVALANASGGFDTPASTGVVNWNYSGAIEIDYDANGLDDLLVPYSGGTWWVMLGSASGVGLGSPSDTGIATVATGTGTNAHAFDIDGDGRDDLIWAELYGFGGGDAIRYRLRQTPGTFGGTTTLAGPLPADSMISSGVFGTANRRNPYRVPDFNGDSRGDVIYKQTDRFWDDKCQCYWLTNYSLNALTSSGSSFGVGIGASSQHEFADFNGDGMTDLFYYTSGATFQYHFSRGTSFTGALSAGSIAPYSFHWAILDWDSDGYDDVLLPHTSSGLWYLMRSSGETLTTPVSTGISTGGAATPIVGDANGDGLDDLVYLTSGWQLRLHAGINPDLLQTATDGHGNLVTFNYAPLPSANYTKYADAVFPAIDFKGALYVVNSAVASNGVGGTFTKSFHYYGAQVHAQGRGFLGFYAAYKHDSRNGIQSYDYFHRHFPYTGTRFQGDVVQPDAINLISRTIDTWTAHEYSSLDGPRYLPFMSASAAHAYEVGGALNTAHIRTVSVANSVDWNTGTLYLSTTTITEPSTANGVQSGASYSRQTYHPLANLFNDFTYWCFGRSGLTQQINSHNQYSGGSQTRQLNTSWNGPLCRPTQQQIQPGDPQYQVTVDIAYDGFGNVNSETVTGVGMSPRTTTSVWASPGSFPTSITRPVSATFSETTQKTWNYAHGVPASETDPNGISVSWLYDNFGRRIQENRPDGTDTTWSYNTCTAVGSCQGPNNKLVVIETRRDASDATINDRWTYLDLFDRTYISTTRALSGAYDRSEIAFDALGRVAQRAAPAWWSSPVYYWTTYQYDLLNRPTQESRPVSDTDPTLQTTYFYYEGLTSRVVDAQGKQTSTVANALGAAARSSDHLLYYQSFDYDAFGSPVRVMDSSGNTLQSATFNIRGMRTASIDLDMGSWTYVPNALGELASQTDANAKTTSFTFDWQSRPLTRVFPEGAGSITATWTWGQSAAAKNIGKLASSQISGTGVTTYSEAHTFDALGRPSQTQFTEGANNYLVNTSYSTSTGFLDTLTYPTSTSAYRLKLQYEYQYGHLLRVKDFNAPTTVFWLANATDARGLVTDETLGNGLRTTKSFDLVTGLVDYIRTGPGGGTTVQNLSYLFDKVGNLTQRQDGNQSLTESFFYDDLYRLDYSQLNGSTNLDLSYNSYGNILTKVQAGVYNYAYAYHATKLHAVTSITGTGPAVGSYGYDADGNMTTRLAGDITWFANNLPKRIRKSTISANDTSEFQYAPSGMRWRHAYKKGSTTYTHVYVGSLLEKVTQGANTEWKHYIHANGQAVALLERHSGGAITQWYLLKDHLGSTDVIANNAGGVFVRESNDAFGKRRGTAWTGAPTATEINNMNTSTRRGFTFHEHLDSTDLIHMNGRVYDPSLGRFLSADPSVDGVFDSQGWNRYAYVHNNPLSFADPTGFHRRFEGRPHRQNRNDRWRCTDCYSLGISSGSFVTLYGQGPRRPSSNVNGVARTAPRPEPRRPNNDDGVEPEQTTCQITLCKYLREAAAVILDALDALEAAEVAARTPDPYIGLDGQLVQPEEGVDGLFDDILTLPRRGAQGALSAVVRRGADDVSAPAAKGGKPLLGRNPQAGGTRTNTDLPGDRATAKSIFRNQTRGQDVTQATMPNGGVRRTAADGTQIRMNPDGTTRLDLPDRGPLPNGETVHIPPRE